MASKRTWKKRRNKEMENTMNQVKTVMTRVEGVMQNVYVEQRKAKEHKEEKYITQIVKIREMLVKDLKKYGEETHPDLKHYIFEITGILEANGVEILQCQQLDNYDREIMEGRRILVPDKKYHEKVYKVISDGYKWNGKLIQPIRVEVLVCEN